MAEAPIEMCGKQVEKLEKQDEMKDELASNVQRWSGSSSATLVSDWSSMVTLVSDRSSIEEKLFGFPGGLVGIPGELNGVKGIWVKLEPKVKVRVPVHKPGLKCKVVFWTVVGIFLLGPVCIGGPILIHGADRILRKPSQWVNYPTSATKVKRQLTTAPSMTGPVAAIITNPALLSIESLLALLTPPASIASSLTGIPASVVSQLEGPEAISAYLENVVLGEPAWIGTLADPAWEWITSQNVAAATIIPQVVSLQSVELSKALVSLLGASAPDPGEFGAFPPSTFTTSVLVSVTDTRYESVPLETVFTDQHMRDDDGSLSNGAKIGIGIGVPIFVIMLAAFIFMGVHIRRNRVRGGKATMFERAHPQRPMVPYETLNGRGKTGSTNGSNGGSTVRAGADDEDVEIVQIVDGHGNVQEYIADHSLEMAEPIVNHDYAQMNGSAHHHESSGTPQDFSPNVRDSYQSQSTEPTVTNRHSLAGAVIKRKPVGSGMSQYRRQSLNGLLTCEHLQDQGQTPRVSMAESSYEDALSNTGPIEQAGTSVHDGQRGSDAGEDADTEGDDDTIVGVQTGNEHTETVDDGEDIEAETGGEVPSKEVGVAK